MPATNVTSRWVSGDLNFYDKSGTLIMSLDGTNGNVDLPEGLNMASGTPASHPINMEGLTLPANSNAIRGASVNPTRASGWISFSGTVSTSPAAVYSDYRELHTTGTAEVLGIGSFPYMDSGASCKSMYGCQFIAYVSTGATVAAATAVGNGVFALWGKTVIDGATFDSSGIAAAAWLSFQANVTNVQGSDTSMINMEVASGGIQNVLKFQCSGGAGATYFANFTDDNGEPAMSTQTNGGTQAGWIKVIVGSAVRYIKLWDTTPS